MPAGACVGDRTASGGTPVVTILVTTVNPSRRKCVCRRLVRPADAGFSVLCSSRTPVADPPASG